MGDLRALTLHQEWPHTADSQGMKEGMAGHSREPGQGQAVTIPR